MFINFKDFLSIIIIIRFWLGPLGHKLREAKRKAVLSPGHEISGQGNSLKRKRGPFDRITQRHIDFIRVIFHIVCVKVPLIGVVKPNYLHTNNSTVPVIRYVVCRCAAPSYAIR